MINKKKSNMNKRYQVSYDTKENGSGVSRKGVMNYRATKKDIIFYTPQEGRNRINIIPYEIKTKNHPLVKKGEFEIGDKDYVMDIYVHRNVGPTEGTLVCLKNTYGKPCPICELSAKLRKEGKEKEANDFKASRRVYYNIEDLKEPGKIKIFETSHYLFEKELIDEARDDEEGGFVDFADPIDGKEIKFKASKVSLGGREFLEYKSFGFEDREEISDELMEEAISFDEIMTIPTYEEAEKILYGADDEQEDEEVETKSKHKQDDNEDDEEVKPKKKPLQEEDKEEEFTPKKANKTVVEEDEEEEPTKKSCSGKCPFGHKFGSDCDGYDDCDDCDIWDKCCKGSNE